ncbi:unnamed protein product [Amoebophrya sp. A25]|nr:unnamed protein product [Amoebophrya sp. A25]|eukprot:GSA25T00021984001.1
MTTETSRSGTQGFGGLGTLSSGKAVFDETKLKASTKGHVDSQAMDFLRNAQEKLIFDERVTNPRHSKDFANHRDKFLKIKERRKKNSARGSGPSSSTTSSSHQAGEEEHQNDQPTKVMDDFKDIFERHFAFFNRKTQLFHRRVTTFMCPLWLPLHLADFAGGKTETREASEPSMQVLYQGLVYFACGLITLTTGILVHNAHHRLLASTWAGLEDMRNDVTHLDKSLGDAVPTSTTSVNGKEPSRRSEKC